MGRIKFRYNDENKMEQVIEYNTNSVMDALKKFENDFYEDKAYPPNSDSPMITHMDVLDKNCKIS
jgi:hypothetical protein